MNLKILGILNLSSTNPTMANGKQWKNNNVPLKNEYNALTKTNEIPPEVTTGD